MFGEKKKRIPGEFDAAFAGMAQGYSPLSQATASPPPRDVSNSKVIHRGAPCGLRASIPQRLRPP